MYFQFVSCFLFMEQSTGRTFDKEKVDLKNKSFDAKDVR